MSNTLGSYDPLFYAQEGLKALQKALGLAPRVFRGYDKTPQSKGSITSIRVPQVFASASAPAWTLPCGWPSLSSRSQRQLSLSVKSFLSNKVLRIPEP